MNQAMKNRLMGLLTESSALTESGQIAPHDYASMRESILQLELQNEIGILSQWLQNSPDHFEQLFKDRCRQREKASDETIPFSQMPNSPANHLYWQFAIILFAPRNLKEILNIVLPSLSSTVTVTLELSNRPRVFGHRKAEDVLEPRLVIKPFSAESIQCPPELDQLCQMVIAEQELLCLEDLTQFGLAQHVKLQRLLLEKCPQLAAKLYHHNVDFQTLEQDIKTLINKGTSPYEAIERLILGFTFGGTRVTGREQAGESAEIARLQFYNYMDALPAEIYQQLMALKSGSLTLENIMNDEIKMGGCVETASGHLREILNANSKNPLLHFSPAMLPQDIQALKAKYRLIKESKKLSSEYDALLCQTMPVNLIKMILERVYIDQISDLLNLILNFPPALFDNLFANMTLSDPQQKFKDLADMVEDGVFNSEQKLPLIQALIKNFARFSMRDSLLVTIAKRNNYEFMREALVMIPVSDRVKMIEHLDATEHPASMLAILECYPVEQRLSLLQRTHPHGLSAFHLAISTPQILFAMLRLLSDEDKLIAIKTGDSHGNTLLHLAAKYHAGSVAVLLQLYPQSQQIELINLTNHQGKRALDLAVHLPTAMKQLLECYPQEQRLTVISNGNILDNQELSASTMVTMHALLLEQDKLELIRRIFMYFEIKRISVLATLIQLIPLQHRTALIEQINADGTTLLHKMVNIPDCLLWLLALYGPEQKVEVLAREDAQGITVLQRAAAQVEHLHAILQGLPQNSRLLAITQQNSNGQTVLYSAVECPQSFHLCLSFYAETQRRAALDLQRLALFPKSLLTVVRLLPAQQRAATIRSLNLCVGVYIERDYLEMLKLIPDEEKLTLLIQVDRNGQTLLHHFAMKNPNLLSDILEIIPAQDRLAAIAAHNNLKQMVLHLAASNRNLCKKIMTIIPAGDCMSLVAHCDDYGRSVLHYSAKNPQMLKSLLLLYPSSKRLAAVQLADKIGQSTLQLAATSTSCLKAILECLPETQRFEMLMLPVNGQTIADKIIRSSLTFAVNEVAFKQSYLPMYFEIVRGLMMVADDELTRRYVDLLKSQLDKCTSFIAFKTCLDDFISKNADSALAQGLSSTMEIVLPQISDVNNRTRYAL